MGYYTMVSVLILLLIFFQTEAVVSYVNDSDGSYSNFDNLRKTALTILLMGDTQYHFKCEPGNTACKKASQRCRQMNGLDFYLRRRIRFENNSMRAGQMDCTKIESRYANKVQRQALESLIGAMKYPPSTLIINGDLTDFGHNHQLREFEKGWMHSFPIPILAGLGNHDYENNINDCTINYCAQNMMSWFTNYARNESLRLDYKKIMKSTFDTAYNGSFAYAKRVCSVTGANCAHVIQLNNAIDYETEFSSLFAEWKIESGMNFLKRELRQLRDIDIPILINMHQCEGTRLVKVKQLLADWIYETRRFGHKKRIAVFYAHMHSLHQAKVNCLHETAVPFVYVGSVTNNRFSLLHIEKNTTSLFGFAANNMFDVEPGQKQFQLLGAVPSIWQNCSPTDFSLFHAFGKKPVHL